MEIKIGEVVERAQMKLLNHWNNDKDGYNQVRLLVADTLSKLKKSIQEQFDPNVEDWKVLETYINTSKHYFGEGSNHENIAMAIFLTFELENETIQKGNNEAYSKELVSIICQAFVDHMIELNKEKYEKRN